ncbi:MAG: hypothetical protein WCD23_02955, partial [Candidatus Acidiferrales bacterium]
YFSMLPHPARGPVPCDHVRGGEIRPAKQGAPGLEGRPIGYVKPRSAGSGGESSHTGGGWIGSQVPS